MSARDELTEILWDNAVADRVRGGKDLKLVPVVRAKAEAVADAILAAGYRKPREAKAEALEEAANAAESMHEPAAPDCKEWADWLRARATAARTQP